MARQEDACWRCGAQWASEEAPRTTLRAIADLDDLHDRLEAAWRSWREGLQHQET